MIQWWRCNTNFDWHTISRCEFDYHGAGLRRPLSSKMFPMTIPIGTNHIRPLPLIIYCIILIKFKVSENNSLFRLQGPLNEFKQRQKNRSVPYLLHETIHKTRRNYEIFTEIIDSGFFNRTNLLQRNASDRSDESTNTPPGSMAGGIPVGIWLLYVSF